MRSPAVPLGGRSPGELPQSALRRRPRAAGSGLSHADERSRSHLSSAGDARQVGAGGDRPSVVIPPVPDDPSGAGGKNPREDAPHVPSRRIEDLRANRKSAGQLEAKLRPVPERIG